MENLENIQLQLYITYGVVAVCILIIIILIIVLFTKINKLSRDRDDWNRELDSEFCYSNPAIVPGEELSRRGYSMYRAFENSQAKNNFNNNFSNSRESQSRF
ncbi:uncharacterized protein LOC141537713 [Cotesia typhae]|uniref:uncharacterized protein LOC141537713 n=1 Tax=Cotesia typhae TaxID=2053667 RepID=UPI003D68BED9